MEPGTRRLVHGQDGNARKDALVIGNLTAYGRGGDLCH